MNGPEDRPGVFDGEAWEAMTFQAWRRHEEAVRRLRQRIFKAVRQQDWAKVRDLQQLMLRSRRISSRAMARSVRRRAGCVEVIAGQHNLVYDNHKAGRMRRA